MCVINAIKKQMQATVHEVQGDSLIVREVLEGNDDNEDNLARDTALQSLTDSLLNVGKSPVKLKRLREMK
jgi:hypothetical protein